MLVVLLLAVDATSIDTAIVANATVIIELWVLLLALWLPLLLLIDALDIVRDIVIYMPWCCCYFSY